MSNENGTAQPSGRDVLLVPAEPIGRSVRLSAELAETLRALQADALAAQPAIEILRERVAQLEDQLDRSRAMREQVLAALSTTADADQLQALAALLGAWTQRPNDLLVMVKLSEESSRIASVVQALQQIRRVILAG